MRKNSEYSKCSKILNTSFFFLVFFFKHVHFTTPDDVTTLILFKFLYCSFYDKKKNKKQTMNTVNVLKFSTHRFLFVCLFVCLFFLQNVSKCSCSPRTYVVEVVPEHLYMSRLMTKSTKWLCAQPKLRSVWASA